MLRKKRYQQLEVLGMKKQIYYLKVSNQILIKFISAKYPYEGNCQFLTNKREAPGLNHFNNSKAFIEYSNDMDDIYKNIEEFNSIKKDKILIVFDDMIVDMLKNKKT